MKVLLHVAALLLLIVRESSGNSVELPATVAYRRNISANAELICKFSSSADGVYWLKGTNIIYDTSKDSNASPDNYTFVSDPSQGVFKLMILKLQYEDSGEYRCQSFPQTATKTAKVTVGDPPSEPVLQPAASVELEEDQEVTFKCESPGGYPAPTFTWTKDGQALTTSPLSPNGSEVIIRLSYTDHGKALQCTATNALASIMTERTLEVKFKPRVTVSMTGSDVAAVERGKPFSLRCDVTSFPAVSSVVWKSNGTQLSVSDFVLDLPVGIEDDVVYECTASNSLGTTMESQSIEVHYAPIVSVAQGDRIMVNETQKLRLDCQATAKPSDITYKWMKDGNDLTFSSLYTISSVAAEHAGIYTCLASNTMVGGVEGRGDKSIDVVVNYPPSQPTAEIRPSDQSGVYTAGGMASFTCSAGEGHPEVTYRWFKSGQELRANSKTFSINQTSFLDSGIYKCQTSNFMGRADSPDLMAEFHEKPEFVKSSSEMEEWNAGDEEKLLSCEYRGLPQPDVLWYRNDVLIQRNNSRYTIVETINITAAHSYVRTTSALKFKGTERRSVDMDDVGTYRCKAKSSLGFSSSSSTFSVNVLFPPVFIGQKKVAADLGSETELNCEFRSYPPVSSIIISQNGQPVISDESVNVSRVQTVTHADYSSQKVTLTFTKVQSKHYGMYSCQATNDISTTIQKIALQRAGRPDAPTDVVVANKTWSSFSISWTPGFDGGKTQNFVAIVNGEKHETGSDNAWTLNGLQPATEYTVQVVGENSFGQSEPSDSLKVRTNSLSIPIPQIAYNKDKTVTVTFNSTQFCVIILGSAEVDSSNSVALFQEKCHFIKGRKVFKLDEPLYKYYLAKACVSGREHDVCNSPARTEEVVSEDKSLYIIIGVVVGVVLLFIIVAAVAVVIVKRRKPGKKINKKSISSPIGTGHVNPVMVRPTDDIETETPYATFTPTNNDLNTGSTFRQPPITDHRDSENLDYIYASVQKKPTDSVKYVNTFNDQQPVLDGVYENHHRGDSPNIESNSDNTEQDTLDEMPVFNKENGLSLILGNEPGNYRRFSNTSESGYSTPESRAKKVVYEVIV